MFDFVFSMLDCCSRGTPMEGKIHYVSNVVLGPPDFMEPKRSAWKTLMRGTKQLESRMALRIAI